VPRPHASLKVIAVAAVIAAAAAAALGAERLLATAAHGPRIVTATLDSASSPAAVAAPAAPAATPVLSARQMAGQRIIYSYNGLTPPASLLSLISHGEAAGVIFFGRNIASRAQLRAVVRKLQRADQSPDNPVRAPLLLMTDQEGGQVRRLSGAPQRSEKQIGQAAHPGAAATAAGRGAALNLRDVGLNVNLAPVLDVYRKAGDFDDRYGRSYSTRATVVATLGADFITAQQHAGVAATAKHFPGLGAAARSQDTDAGPVSLHLSRATLRDVDELPYKAAVAVGVRLVMVSWAVYPALAPGRPAGLARAVVKGELRGRLGFAGVTVTDALGAGALRSFGTIGHRAELAAGAGVDLVLCSGGSVLQGEHAMNTLSHSYSDGVLGKAAFETSVQRVVALRTGL
jgi:beta-N-acetylhexosaminidase